MTRATVVGLIALCFFSCDAATPQHPPVDGRLEQFSLRGVAVDDEFVIMVRLPKAYDEHPSQRFPLVLQLDANTPFLMEQDVTAGFASKLEAEGAIVPTVVVGIGYTYSAQEPKRGRNRDYTLPLTHPDHLGDTSGGAPQFLAFLRDELMPVLESRYRLEGPEGRALFGHSLGGLFVAYAFVHQEKARPFVSGYVAGSPSLWFDEGSLYEQFEALRAARAGTEMPGLLFATVGALEDPVMTVYLDDFSQRVAAAGFVGLRVEARQYPSDHMGVVAPSFRDGLQLLFAAQPEASR